MLNHIYIKNFALIEELNLDVQNGFSVITGETGAGKSIILGAISLLTGERAESRFVQENASKCIVEATFDIKEYHLEKLFDAHNLDYEDECLIRREVTALGKSRAYINDTPVNLSILKEITEKLIDIHSQHQNLLLNREDFQLNVVDIMANSQKECFEFQEAFQHFKAIDEELRKRKEKLNKQKAEEDYIRYQYQQLKDFSPQNDEDISLEEELNALTHAEEIKSAFYETNILINGDNEKGVLDGIRTAKQTMQNLARFYPKADEFAQRLENLHIEIKDIGHEVASMAENMEYNPQRLEEVNNRLDELYTLEKKHGAENSNDLLNIIKELEEKLEIIENADEQIDLLSAERLKVHKVTEEKAEALSQKRKSIAHTIEEETKQTLILLGIPNVTFEIEFKEKEQLSFKGKDTITFKFSANKSSSPKPIAQVASGGEIARVMLALKSMTSKKTQLPTIIFDEIDTGVSGSIAENMALIMHEMCKDKKKQVITITHLPQIAACGTSHLKVYKKDDLNRTTSHICQLTKEERIIEIANMLSGNKVSEAAIKNAKELLRK